MVGQVGSHKNIPPSPSKILVAISLDPDDSKELISWAIRVPSNPGDSIIAIHILVGDETKKNEWTKKKWQIRQAKAHVISVLGEFAGTCLSKPINLEARVGFGASVGKGLVEEARTISADYLVLGGLRNRSNRNWLEVTRYCYEHAPKSCTVVSVGRSQQPSQNSNSHPNWLNKNRLVNSQSSSGAASIAETETSPRTVLDELDGEYNSTEDDDTFCFSNSSTAETGSFAVSPNCGEKAKERKRLSPYKIISTLFSSSFRKRNGSYSTNVKEQNCLLKCFSYEEIAIATDNFKPENIVGRGGYSEVYRGDLSNGRKIAVKRLAKDNKINATKEKEFLTELGIISHVCHPNTANLVGYCVENGLYLIFNYSQNGNLFSALHGKAKEPLKWALRYKIALGVARGVHYLHKSCKHRIIHRDIKASNVLLGIDYEPQITDFGLAKWLPNKWTHHAVIPIEGTFGYLAPEYFMNGIVDEKTDVFAFGILLLEIVSGRRPVDPSKQNLLLWAKPLMESGNISELADPNLEGEFDEDEMHRVVLTASYCVRQSAVSRPEMSEVLELLTNGHGGEVPRSWRMQKFTSDELDDYSMVFGYEVPTDVALEDFL